ncbi:hypothetical protein Golax_018457 [Gossypium laxum]|uniref:RNase H type-1 domain-containing protein n=1 Tax=Gossypium laxum TaxID=34288 RepID=A0A7J8Z422_9ROSI|nr:hypothetical protein [Gossypium laxum]
MSLPIPTTDQSDKGCESSTHTVRDCLFSAQVWSKLDVQWPSSMVNFNEWLSWLLENSDKNRKGVIAVTIWAIWFSRNKFVHERKVQSLEEIVTFIRSFGLEYRSSAENLKNDKGFIMGSGFQGHNLVHSVVIAEALAILRGLQFALDLGFSNVILGSDSRLVVNNIQKSSEDYSESRPFTWDPKNLARKFQSEGDSFWVEDALLKAMEVANSDRQSGRPP